MHAYSKFLTSALFASVQARYLSNELSFGHHEKISPTLRAIPDWYLLGTPHPPEILSNKVILTPPAPGNQRGGIWSEKTLEHTEWEVDVEFRATGTEHGGGNLQIWYARNGQHDVATSSIYTVGKFDGLAIVIDQYAGSGGFVRGFLNDGSKEFKSHHAVDSLAFGHCLYSYRNLGRPSKVTLTQTSSVLKLTLDGTVCFESDKVKLPRGYNFGISAASASDPDSFEIFKFITTTESHSPETHNTPAEKHDHQTFLGSTSDDHQKEPENLGDIPAWSDLKEVPADQVSTSQQFADLHNRLQGLSRHLLTTSRDLIHFQNIAASRHETILELLHKLEVASGTVHNVQGQVSRLENVERKLDQISQDVRQTKADLHNALDHHAHGLRTVVADTHESISGSVRATATGTGKVVLIVLGSQALTVGAYLLYKRRKNAGPKKYL